ncbi:MAG: response regulator [Saprospiraceae bacterium]
MSFEKMKIMIIEDDFIQAENLKENLIQFGYDVIGPAHDSVKAMMLLKSSIPDIMIVDIKLENSPLNGIEIVDHFKKISIFLYFFLQNYDQFTRDIKKVNPNYFLTKPYYPHQIDTAIDFALYNFMVDQVNQVFIWFVFSHRYDTRYSFL